METQTETMGELFKLQQKKEYPNPESEPTFHIRKQISLIGTKEQ